jgi:hypothetical protein
VSDTNSPETASPALSVPSHGSPETESTNGRLPPGSPFSRVLDTVDRLVQAGRARTLAVQRAASLARRLPAILFGATLAVFGLSLLVLAVLRGLVEVSGAIFSSPKPWVSWLVGGGILLSLGVLVGTVRNTSKDLR